MPRTRRSPRIWIIVVAIGVGMPTAAKAQGRIPVTSMNPQAPAVEPDLGPLPSSFDTGVSFLDSALPRSLVRLRFDMDQYNRRPTRAEFLFPSDGFVVPETRVHMQELYTHVEFGLNEWFSTFLETPYRWVNPELNANLHGVGDLSFGGKFAGWNGASVLTAFQLKFSANTAEHALTGTGHWSVEPSFLLNWRLSQFFVLEGQVGYWVPLGGTDYAGDVLKYGLGLSFGGRNASAVQLMPVAEIVGWTMTSGRELIQQAPGVFISDSAAGDTVINGCLGLRFTLGQTADVYAGYSRSFVGHPWFRDMFRVEFRLFY